MDTVDHDGFQNLHFGQSAFHLNDRLILEDDAAFGDGVQFAAKAVVGQIVEKIRAEFVQAAQIFEVDGKELECFQIVHQCSQSAGYEKVSLRRQSPRKQAEYGVAGFAVLQVALRHCQLVEIREQGDAHCSPSSAHYDGCGEMTDPGYKVWLLLLYQMSEYSGMTTTEKRQRDAGRKVFSPPRILL